MRLFHVTKTVTTSAPTVNYTNATMNNCDITGHLMQKNNR